VVQAHLDADRHHIDDVRLLDHKWCERIWTPVATCAQQGREVFPFLLDSVHRGCSRHNRGRYGREVFQFLLDSVHRGCGRHNRGREVFPFLLDSVQAYLSGTSPPSLLPCGP